MSIEGISQRETSDFLEQATSATSNEGISQRVTRAFLQRVIFCNQQLLQRVMTKICNQ